MTLSIGDHLVIKRNGKIVDPNSESFHEYEVVGGHNGNPEINYGYAPNSKHPPKSMIDVRLEVVE